MRQRKQESTFEGSRDNWRLGQPVVVRMMEWIPPDDESGDWKDTGKGFTGVLVSGPQSKLEDPEHGMFWYILPPDGVTVGGNLHPRPISEKPFDPYGGQDIRLDAESHVLEGTIMLRFVVEAIEEAVALSSN